MQGLEYNYYLHYFYTQEQQEKIEQKFNQIRNKWKAQQVQISMNLHDFKFYQKWDQTYIEITDGKYLVEYKLNASYCISLSQLIYLIINRVISMKVHVFLQILQSIVNEIVQNININRAYLLCTITPMNCWIILEDIQYGCSPFQNIPHQFDCLIILSDEQYLFTKYKKGSIDPKCENRNFIVNFVQDLNTKMRHIFQGEFIISPQQYEVIFNRDQECTMGVEIIQNNEVEYLGFIDTMSDLSKQTQNSIFDEYIISHSAQGYFMKDQDYYVQEFIPKRDLIRRIIDHLRLFSKVIHPDSHQSLYKHVQIVLAFNQIFNIDHDLLLRKNQVDYSTNQDREIDYFLSSDINKYMEQCQQSKWTIIRESAKLIDSILHYSHQQKECKILADINIHYFDDEYKQSLRDWLIMDLNYLFQKYLKHYSDKQEHFIYRINFFQLFNKRYSFGNFSEFLYLATQLEDYEIYLLNNQTQIQQYLDIDNTIISQNSLQQIINDQQPNITDQNLLSLMKDKILHYSNSNNLNHNDLERVQENMKYFIQVLANYLRLINLKYDQKLQQLGITWNISEQQIKLLESIWENQLISKPDLVQILVLKSEYCKIIVRDFFEQGMKDLIDDAYKMELIKVFNQQPFNIANK